MFFFFKAEEAIVIKGGTGVRTFTLPLSLHEQGARKAEGEGGGAASGGGGGEVRIGPPAGGGGG